MEKYYTVVIPFVESPHATQWHPTDRTGPFSTLSRGAFWTVERAISWARDNLKGAPYSIREIDPTTDLEKPRHVLTPPHMNGARVTRRGNTIFVPLPREAWRVAHGCSCAYCAEEGAPGAAAWFDTLAIAADPDLTKKDAQAANHTWLVHAPELHGAALKR